MVLPAGQGQWQLSNKILSVIPQSRLRKGRKFQFRLNDFCILKGQRPLAQFTVILPRNNFSEFCSPLKNVAEEHTRVLYSLYGVVEHSGTMRSGHYTAYAKTRTANTHLSNLVLHGDIPQGKRFYRILVFSRYLWQNQKRLNLNFSISI